MVLSFVNQFIIPVLILGGIGLLFGILIALLSKVLAVEPEDDRIETVQSMLPGYNCGACGYPGCNAFATAIINEGKDVSGCKPIKPNQAELIREFLRKQEETN
ncbi:MAG TPA: electron transporter RnfB [Acholeplasmataceae bacterium]|jgi:electron transport complex protein RnfB|nr:electron transporter RnfB [Acholeplasmataceae bacterium]